MDRIKLEEVEAEETFGAEEVLLWDLLVSKDGWQTSKGVKGALYRWFLECRESVLSASE